MLDSMICTLETHFSLLSTQTLHSYLPFPTTLSHTFIHLLPMHVHHLRPLHFLHNSTHSTSHPCHPFPFISPSLHSLIPITSHLHIHSSLPHHHSFSRIFPLLLFTSPSSSPPSPSSSTTVIHSSPFPFIECESVATTATLFLYFVVCMPEVQNCFGTSATEHGSECAR